jgi:hypothetical protein
MKYRPLIMLLIIFAVGCSSSGQNPTAIEQPVEAALTTHTSLGLWQFMADPAAQTLDVIPLREQNMHLNALVFLEPPVLVNLTLDSLEFNGNIIEADIGLRHPFLGLTEFSGFDVCGILISNGSVSGFSNPDLVMAGAGDTRLLNPDGLTRWWNPAEFPSNGTMFGYVDGLLGVPDSVAGFSSTLNPYKFYCDDLTDPDAPVSSIDAESRCLFSAGQKNIRHFTIELGNDGLVFNYAVDANWKFPQGDPPYQAPDDFPPDANRPEAWNASITETENSLWNDGADNGGNISLVIDLWDHFDAALNTVYIESPGNFAATGPIAPTGGAAGYSTYQVDITDATPSPDSIDILVIAESEETGYGGVLSGETVSAYFLHTAEVSDEQPSEPADPVEGNVELEVWRNTSYAITSLKVLWTGNGSPEYAVYADTNPYDGITPDTFIDATTAEELTISTMNYSAFSTTGCYAFTVRARSQAGSALSESDDSQYAYVEMEDFDGGADPSGGWGLYYRNASHQLSVQSATIDGSALQMGPSIDEIWTAAVSPMIPTISDTEYSVIEIAQRASNFQDNAWAECLAAMYAQTSIGWADALPVNGNSNWKDLYTPPLDAAIDGTYPLEDQLNPGSYLISLNYFFSGDAHGWRIFYLDNSGNPPPIRFTRASIPELHQQTDVYASWVFGDHNTYPDAIGLVEPVWVDEIAVVIY